MYEVHLFIMNCFPNSSIRHKLFYSIGLSNATPVTAFVRTLPKMLQKFIEIRMKKYKMAFDDETKITNMVFDGYK